MATSTSPLDKLGASLGVNHYPSLFILFDKTRHNLPLGRPFDPSPPHHSQAVGMFLNGGKNMPTIPAASAFGGQVQQIFLLLFGGRGFIREFGKKLSGYLEIF